MASSPASAVFGKRREPHTIIIAQGDHIRHFTIRPWMAVLAGICVAAFAIGYLGATTYLVLRDDLIGATIARQARMQQAYEDRISALRAQVDRITSRQLLDQQLMEEKVAELIKRQDALSQRHGRLGPMLDRAGATASGQLPETVPAPEARPNDSAKALDPGAVKHEARLLDTIRTGSVALRSGNDGAGLSTADRADRIFMQVNRALRNIEEEQLARIDNLATGTYEAAGAIADALTDAGLDISDDYEKSDVGGPLIPADPGKLFELKVRELDTALDTFEALKAKALHFPIANPAKGRKVTSSYGYRRDPLLGRRAMHSGMDFRAPAGAPVKPAAAGTVLSAGWNGGYGRMVEVDHGNGYTTRYGHLSKILVKAGDKVSMETLIGNVGSSGRSTGPHLHYEVRRNGDALDPLPFIKAGRKVRQLLGV